MSKKQAAAKSAEQAAKAVNLREKLIALPKVQQNREKDQVLAE